MHISHCCQFSDIHISQGSVATYLRFGEIFKYEFVANLPMSLPVKEFWKSVNIGGSYGQEFSVLFFFETVYNELPNADLCEEVFSGQRILIIILIIIRKSKSSLHGLTSSDFSPTTDTWQWLLSFQHFKWPGDPMTQFDVCLTHVSVSSPWSEWAGCRRQGHAGSKTSHQQNLPVLNWKCWLTNSEVDMYTHTRLMALCQDYLGEPVPKR